MLICNERILCCKIHLGLERNCCMCFTFPKTCFLVVCHAKNLVCSTAQIITGKMP